MFFVIVFYSCVFFFKQKTAYEMRISDWSSDVCSSDLHRQNSVNEPLSEVIRIRVTPSHAARLGEAAALSGLSLSNYVRRRLSADNTLQEELTLLRQIVADLGHLRDSRKATFMGIPTTLLLGAFACVATRPV